MKPDTACLHGYKHQDYHTGAISVPIFQAATYYHKSTTEPSEHIYSRVKNPTRDAAEGTVAALEGGQFGFGFSTGMAAIQTVMSIFQPGSHIVATNDLFGGSIRLFTGNTSPYQFTFVDTCDIAQIKAAITPATKAIYIETPTNPMAQITDIAAVAQAFADSGLTIIVDNTFLSPYFQNPLKLGAHIVIHSGTKYLGGHSDAMAGFAVTNCPQLAERLQANHINMGATLAPMDSFLIVRGIKTLALRMERAQENAQKLANWLLTHPKVTKVYYPGLPSHPGHDIMKTHCTGFGAMMSFEVDCPQTAINIVEQTQIITYAESLGCVNSLITIPVLCTHKDVPEEERLARGITPSLLRFSVGIENFEDLRDDLILGFA